MAILKPHDKAVLSICQVLSCKHQKHTYLNDYAKSLVALLACVFGEYLLIVTICLHCMSKLRENLKGVRKEKIKCVGETILSFDKGFSQHPYVSLG